MRLTMFYNWLCTHGLANKLNFIKAKKAIVLIRLSLFSFFYVVKTVFV